MRQLFFWRTQYNLEDKKLFRQHKLAVANQRLILTKIFR